MISPESCQIIVGAFGGMFILATWIWKILLVVYGYKVIKLLVNGFYKNRRLKYGY